MPLKHWSRFCTSRLLLIDVALLALALTSVARTASPEQLSDTFVDRRTHPAIEYATRPATDRVAKLIQQIKQGGVQLTPQGPSGYLRALLRALDVPIESQIVVFTPDSFQANRITMRNPRALYFNDVVAVGWVKGGVIELAAQDPQQGVNFYTLDATWSGQPTIPRQHQCLTCHYGYSSASVPGMLVRSVMQFAVDHRLPMHQRWGGWYVTGKTGSLQHMGNTDPAQLFGPSRPSNTYDWQSLTGRIDTDAYLSQYSDVAALMVFDHQMRMMNLLTRIGWEARVAAHDKSDINLRDVATEVVDYMLFVDEAPLPSALQSSNGFPARFAAAGSRDRKGRSLRDLDLRTRLLKYPCSYLIQSAQFHALPAAAKDAIYQRMWQVLSGQDKDRKYARLTAADRTAIIEILGDTQRDLPAYFGGNR